jgi:hypothetical protein
MTLRYAGAPCFVTPCKWLGDENAGTPCKDGQCPGMIEGVCPFYIGLVKPEYRGFFEDV